MSEKLFFPVEDVYFQDLFDWSQYTLPTNPKCSFSGMTVGKVKRNVRTLKRQDSETGNLTTVNVSPVALFRVGEKVHAISEKCPHAGGPLHLGDIETLPDFSLCIRCPWHSWKYDLHTGKIRSPKGRDLKVDVYPTKVDSEGKIWVGFDEFDSSLFTGELKE